MNDTISIGCPTKLFADTPEFVLWYRPSTGRAAWEAVARCKTEREAVHAVGCGNRHGGKWIVLPNGKEP